MMIAALLLLAAAAPAPAEIVAQAPALAWADVPADELLVMDLDGGRRVVIQLAPAFAPVHIANVRALAKAGWFDGTSINRVQDNYVAQWGDATERKPLPPGIVRSPPEEYVRAAGGLAIRPLGSPDAYAERTGFADGWPVAVTGREAVIPHCYAMVGVGRNMTPDTGSGAELYAVIGHATRHLDRNVATVGRVVAGMEHLSALPRGTEALGFYRTAGERTPIARIRLASDMPPAERPAFQWMRTDDPVFARYLHARANRQDAFFNRPAGGVDLCNAPVPVRARP